MEDKFPRVTQTQIDIWMNDPVTHAVLSAYSEISNRIDAGINSGSFIVLDNNDQSMNQLSLARGHKQGLENAKQIKNVLELCQFIEKDEK